MSHLFLELLSLDADARSFEDVSGFRSINTMPGRYTESGT
jgi:hypothetical protein